MKFILLISVFVGHFGSPGCGSRSSRPKSKRIHADPGPDPQTGENFNLFELLEQIRIRNTDPDFGSNYFFYFFLSRENFKMDKKREGVYILCKKCDIFNL
jgi:hypothetical protein